MAHPIRDDGFIDAEWREVAPGPLDPQSCPQCGKDYVAVFGGCYFCGWQMTAKPQGCLAFIGFAVLIVTLAAFVA